VSWLWPGGLAAALGAAAPRGGFRSPAGPAPGWCSAAGYLQGPVRTVTQLRTTPFLWWHQSSESSGRQRPRRLGGFGQQILPPGRRDGGRRQLDEHLRSGDPRLDPGMHPDLVWQPVALAAIARRAGRDDVLPVGV